MKTLAELRTEIELGLPVFPTTNHDVAVWREEANEFHEVSVQRQSEHPWYKLYHSQQTPFEGVCTDEEKEMMGTRMLNMPISLLMHSWPLGRFSLHSRYGVLQSHLIVSRGKHKITGQKSMRL